MKFRNLDVSPDVGLWGIHTSQARCAREVSIVVCRQEDGLYQATVRRYDTDAHIMEYADVPGLSHVGMYVEKPTWLLGEAVQLSYANPDAFSLLRW